MRAVWQEEAHELPSRGRAQLRGVILCLEHHRPGTFDLETQSGRVLLRENGRGLGVVENEQSPVGQRPSVRIHNRPVQLQRKHVAVALSDKHAILDVVEDKLNWKSGA